MIGVASDDQQIDIYSIDDARRIGSEVHNHFSEEISTYQDDDLSSYIKSIGKKLVDKTDGLNSDVTVTILDHGYIDKLLYTALMGGYIYIDRNILVYLNNEAELAAILAHEIGHISIWSKFNSFKVYRYGDNCKNLFYRPLSEGISREEAETIQLENEFEADKFAVELLIRSGYDPMALVHFLAWADQPVPESNEVNNDNVPDQEGKKERCPNTHPPIKERISRIKEIVAEKGVTSGYLGRDVYLTQINGIHAWPDDLRILGKDPLGFSKERIEIVELRNGDTIESLINEPRYQDRSSKEAIFLINRFDENTIISVGDKIKMLIFP